MGTFPSDFSDREFVYEVKAGNGDIANWTIQIIDFKKWQKHFFEYLLNLLL